MWYHLILSDITYNQDDIILKLDDIILRRGHITLNRGDITSKARWYHILLIKSKTAPHTKGPHIVHLKAMCHLCGRIGQGGHLGFLIGPKSTNLVEDVEILIQVKFWQIPFSTSRGEVEFALANQRLGRLLLFPDRLKIQTWKRTLSSCFLSRFVKFNSEEKSKLPLLTACHF